MAALVGNPGRLAVVLVQTPANELELSCGGKKNPKQNACYMMFPPSAAGEFPGSFSRMGLADPFRLLWGTAPSERL